MQDLVARALALSTLGAAAVPGHYSRNALWALGANNYTLLSPSRLTVNIDSKGFYLPSQITLDLSQATTWDTQSPTDYTVATNRAGEDFYIYACEPASGSTPVILVSANSTVPVGYTSSNSRKIGGFHCFCLSMSTPQTWSTGLTVRIGTTVVPTTANGYWYRATVAGTTSSTTQPTWPTTVGSTVSDNGITWFCEIVHPLAGFVTGDILPASIWDLQHYSRGQQAGHVWNAKNNRWEAIYMQSGTQTTTASVSGGTVVVSHNWMDFVDDLAQVNEQMFTDREFQNAALGSNEMTNIAGSVSPVITGGHYDQSGTAGTATSAASPSTNISAMGSSAQFGISINGSAAQQITFNPSTGTTGALIASLIQTAIQASISAFPDYRNLAVTASYGTTYVVSSAGNAGGTPSVVITAGTSNDCTAALKLGVANGGTEVTGIPGRRMVSYLGNEDMCGVWYQWTDTQSYRYDSDASVQDGGSSYAATITYEASPGGNPVYVKFMPSTSFGNPDVPYLCSNIAGAVDRIVSFGSLKMTVVYDANASAGTEVYINSGGTQPGLALCNLSGYTANAFIPTNNPGYDLQIVYSSSASNYKQLYWNDSTLRFECATASGANVNWDLAMDAPAFSWYTSLSGSKGQLYKQGIYGDVKLLAGVNWNNGAGCGSRGRNAANYRWYTSTSIGCRGRSEPAV